jgi:hypothetical protein
MFRLATGRSLAPHAKRGSLHFGPHQVDNLSRCEAELSLDCIESGPIFPGHLNHPIYVGGRKRICGYSGHFLVLLAVVSLVIKAELPLSYEQLLGEKPQLGGSNNEPSPDRV